MFLFKPTGKEPTSPIDSGSSDNFIHPFLVKSFSLVVCPRNNIHGYKNPSELVIKDTVRLILKSITEFIHAKNCMYFQSSVLISYSVKIDKPKTKVPLFAMEKKKYLKDKVKICCKDLQLDNS